MEGEYFYGAVLDKKGAKATWKAAENEPHDQAHYFKLMIKQILLGHGAKEGEYNVVEVQTTSQHTAVKTPIAVLKVGETRSTIINLEFPETPVTFTLIEGSGPVYIHGNIVAAYTEVVDEAEDECVELIDEEQEDETKEEETAGSKKRKVSENGAVKATNGGCDNQKNNKKQKTG